MATLYILHSQTSGRYYTGSTANFDRRFEEHNRGQTKSTKSGRPWACVFKCEVEQSRARKLEGKIKKLKSKQIVKKILNENSIDFLRE